MAGRVKRGTKRIVRGPDAPTWEKPSRPAVDIDWDAVRELRSQVDGHALAADGQCHTNGCDRPTTGERRFCGPCAAGRDSQYERPPLR